MNPDIQDVSSSVGGIIDRSSSKKKVKTDCNALGNRPAVDDDLLLLLLQK